ncbi:hypothetical protein MGYG_04992 [Nannizzia gypsea CBS 118893]|uniref:Uncharacterized protein n=1 Tax=Arthroderma gypseum (strain ATCC MYA-4604 / CBS 118893) TaxID=535722 RepID=E4UXZ6_ARTGP|nr:hypothetical protein MGYG_04992 [Nannizzia gypsea CBS 118893]EFR01989.1 hypothetical protein MGYG_04992 [Nannizzia gypsea CBS 118893]
MSVRQEFVVHRDYHRRRPFGRFTWSALFEDSKDSKELPETASLNVTCTSRTFVQEKRRSKDRHNGRDSETCKSPSSTQNHTLKRGGYTPGIHLLVVTRIRSRPKKVSEYATQGEEERRKEAFDGDQDGAGAGKKKRFSRLVAGNGMISHQTLEDLITAGSKTCWIRQQDKGQNTKHKTQKIKDKTAALRESERERQTEEVGSPYSTSRRNKEGWGRTGQNSPYMPLEQGIVLFFASISGTLRLVRV